VGQWGEFSKNNGLSGRGYGSLTFGRLPAAGAGRSAGDIWGQKMGMAANEIERHFTRADGTYAFARWGRPVVPVVFGVEDATLATIKGALEAVVTLAGHRMAETDPDLGANLMIFFFRDWAELAAVPDLDRLVPGLPALVARLEAGGADQYRHFRFEPDGAIRACFAFLKMDGPLADLPAADLALTLAVQVMLLW
jgi:hypothetical protein